MRPTILMLIAVLLIAACQKENAHQSGPMDPTPLGPPLPPKEPQEPPVDSIPDAIEAILGVYHGELIVHTIEAVGGELFQRYERHTDTLTVSFVPPNRIAVGHSLGGNFFFASLAGSLHYDSTTHTATGLSFDTRAHFFPASDSLIAIERLTMGDPINDLTGMSIQRSFQGMK